MKIGQTIQFRPAEWPTDKPPVEGTVIYVHPRSRFVLVEYQVVTMWGDLSVPLRECLPLTHGVADKGDMPKRGCHYKKKISLTARQCGRLSGGERRWQRRKKAPQGKPTGRA